MTDAHGNPVKALNPDGTLQDPIQAPASMPPSYFVDQALKSGARNLLNFWPGASLDAQHPGGTAFNITFTPYANWVFGVYAAANGLDLDTALWGANNVARFSSYPKRFLRGGIPQYPKLLNANYANIALGYAAYKSGLVCTKP